MDALLIPARFNGPARSANGGYAAGSLAHELGDTTSRAVTVSLVQPPPLDSTMRVTRREDDGLELTFGGAVVARAEVAGTELEPVEGVSHEAATAASAAYPGLRSHPFPTCFSCGPGRSDGLRIFPGPVEPREARTRVAAPWTPPSTESADWHEYDESTRRACLASTWAALDCIGGWAGDLGERLMVLAQMTTVVDALPVVGEPHVVMGEWRGHEGRKTWTASTLLDSDGRIVASAEHLWVAVDPDLFT